MSESKLRTQCPLSKRLAKSKTKKKKKSDRVHPWNQYVRTNYRQYKEEHPNDKFNEIIKKIAAAYQEEKKNKYGDNGAENIPLTTILPNKSEILDAAIQWYKQRKNNRVQPHDIFKIDNLWLYVIKVNSNLDDNDKILLWFFPTTEAMRQLFIIPNKSMFKLKVTKTQYILTNGALLSQTNMMPMARQYFIRTMLQKLYLSYLEGIPKEDTHTRLGDRLQSLNINEEIKSKLSIVKSPNEHVGGFILQNEDTVVDFSTDKLERGI